jgi:hypothetical protein
MRGVDTMNNNKKTFIQHFWKVIVAVCLTAGGVIGAASNLTAVLTFLHISVPTKVKPTPIANVTPLPPNPTPQVRPVAKIRKSATQMSNGSQSPNLNGIQGSVDLRYGSAGNEAHASQPSTWAMAKTKVKTDSSVIQVSSGAQSPNISNVGGDVKLDYDSKTTPAASQD